MLGFVQSKKSSIFFFVFLAECCKCQGDVKSEWNGVVNIVVFNSQSQPDLPDTPGPGLSCSVGLLLYRLRFASTSSILLINNETTFQLIISIQSKEESLLYNSLNVQCVPLNQTEPQS